MTLIDHLFVLAFAVAQPIIGLVSFRRFVRRIKAGATADLNHLYMTTMLGHWAMFCVALAIWSSMDRAWPTLGFGLALDWWFLAGVVLAGVAIFFMGLQLRRLRGMNPADLRQQLGDLAYILPRDERELRRFYAVSVTAGIVEETLWRGFLIWYLVQFLPLWAAAIISAIAFGLAHAYQGAAHLPSVTLVGAIFVVLYLVTGSLWLPILLHAVVDIVQGHAAHHALRPAAGPPDSREELETERG